MRLALLAADSNTGIISETCTQLPLPIAYYGVESVFLRAIARLQYLTSMGKDSLEATVVHSKITQ